MKKSSEKNKVGLPKREKIIVKNKKGSSRDWKVVEGESARSFFNNLSTLNDDEKRILLIESAIILSKCGDPNKIRNSITGLVIGYVQSGKTLSFTSLLSLAKDNGYRGAIILAGTKTNLRNQTTDRL
ncbi:MAG TPA: alpha-1,4 polygalactosaminidase, partial [Verrucomicrobiales bacterium]|nr:alpha-1,4 polygalactosaminidase [Verrucomicrobiales bacterium]